MLDPHEALHEELNDRYELEDVLGEGGMGTVYLARDRKHDRLVAIKTIRPELTTEAVRRRFEREISITARLQHPHILPLLDSGVAGDTLYYVMPSVEGESLRTRLERAGGLPVDEVVRIARDVAEGLECAHGQGVVHRDIKPENILLAADYALIMDFGIAKALAEAGGGTLTPTGGVLGSPNYMAPEQFEGTATPQSDLYALGAVLYEALTGHLWSTAEPRSDPGWARAPSGLKSAIEHALERSPEDRWPDAAAFRHTLTQALMSPAGPAKSWRRLTAAAAALAIAASAVAWVFFQRSRRQWAHEVALPQIESLIAQGRHAAAGTLGQRAERYIAADSTLAALWLRMARNTMLTVTPSGAHVVMSAVQGPSTQSEARVSLAEKWVDLGLAPIELERLSLGAYRLRIDALGFDTLEAIYQNRFDDRGRPQRWAASLVPTGTIPPRMARIGPKKLTVNLYGLPSYHPNPGDQVDPAYLLGKYEVTNREYKVFVDADGYLEPEHWKNPFVDGNRTLSWEEGMAEFRDQSGRPGPATWEGGTYPEGLEDHPVGGVSWYEAAAYADFVGVSLPTLFHWRGAAEARGFDMAGFGNFRGEGSSPVGAAPFGPFGIYDLAGNVREWVWNRAGDLRYITGGGWSDPYYMYHQGGLAPPFDRSPSNGIRLADFRDATDEDLAPLKAPIERSILDFVWGADPVGDAVFEALAQQYDYDPGPLESALDSVDETSPFFRRETISFNAAYGGERMFGHLFLPKNVDPPFQVLVYFPGAGSMRP